MPEYKRALAEHGFKAMRGDDARLQPGKLQELMLHETAVSWIRHRFHKTIPTQPWEETPDAYTSRLKAIVADINDNLNVEALCMAFMKRIDTLIEKTGGRLKSQV